MKILAVSDLHFGLTQFDWLAQQAEQYELVIIAGDLLDISGHLDLDSQITVVVKYLRAISQKTRLLVCSGNHDGDEKNEAQEFIARWLQRVRAAGLVVDGGAVEVGDLRLSVCPWWDGPSTREAMQQFLRAEHGHSPTTWLWVHHAPPDGVGVSWTGKEHAGDAFLVSIIQELRPDFVFSGHIHNSPFVREVLGRRASAGPGSSIPAGSTGRRPPILSSISAKGPRAGFPRPGWRRFSSMRRRPRRPSPVPLSPTQAVGNRG